MVAMAVMTESIFMAVLALLMAMPFQVEANPARKATFILGDSLVDVGNNNYFFTLATANHKPYGVDRADKQPTGRFCNGKIIPDLVSKWKTLHATPATLPTLPPSQVLRNSTETGMGMVCVWNVISR